MSLDFNFGIPDEEYLKQELDRQHKIAAQDYDAFYLRPGTTEFRVLPPAVGNRAWYKEVHKHRLNVMGDTVVKLCAKMENRSCPLCDLAQAVYEEGTEDAIERAKSIKARRSYVVNGIIFAAPPGVEFDPGKVYVIELPVTVKNEILEIDRDIQGGFADITGAVTASKGEGLVGVTFRVQRTGQGLQTRYSTRPKPLKTDLSQEFASRGVKVQKIVLTDLSKAFSVDSDEDLRGLAGRFKGENVREAQPQAAPLQTGLNIQIGTEEPETTQSILAAPTPTTMPPPQTAEVNTKTFSMNLPPPPPEV